MVWNWLRRHPWLIDGVLVLALGAGYLGDAIHRHRGFPGLALAVVTVLPLYWRRRLPVTVLAIVTAATVLDTIVYSNDVPFAPALAIYSVAAHVDRRRSLRACSVAAVIMLVTFGLAVSPGQMIGNAILFVAAWIGGDSLGTRRAYTRELEEKAERLEREREVEAARAVAEEQARIARELHDVIAHSLSVIVIQAAAANDVFDSRPDRARNALSEIEATGRGALAELRSLLGAVRGEADFMPQRGLDQLDEVVDQVRAAGLRVAVSIEGAPRPLPAGVDLSAYRIVQEALTNTLKHAQASKADVVIHYGDDALDVQVRDDGRGNGAGGGGTGSGLIGMRERVTTYGGSLDVGPSERGGFAVRARFPL
jgi:signal transduction histidine kinase